MHKHRNRACRKNLNWATSKFIFYLLTFQKTEERRRTAVTATEIQVFTCTGGNEPTKRKITALHKSMDLNALESFVQNSLSPCKTTSLRDIWDVIKQRGLVLQITRERECKKNLGILQEQINSGTCHPIVTHNPIISALNGICHIRKVSRMSIAYKQQVEMWWQQPNSFFKQVHYLECKRRFAAFLSVSRV